MNEVVSEWVQKAEGDYATASREFAVETDPNFDAVCFHAQQCAEKYLKALLIVKGAVPPKVHDLTELDRRLVKVWGEWKWPADQLRLLSRSAVMSRYPGEVAGRQEAEAAFRVCVALRRRARELLGLPI